MNEQVYEVFKERKAVYLVQEVVSGGDLFDQVVRRGESAFTEAAASQMIRQIVSAIAHCHARGVMHRDIKPENILCLGEGDGVDGAGLRGRLHALEDGGDGQLKLCDFGLATEFTPGKPFGSAAGSVEYAAPEVLTYGAGYTCSADVWSIGVLMYPPHSFHNITSDHFLFCFCVFGKNWLFCCATSHFAESA